MWTSLQVLACACLSVRAASLIQPEWGYYFDQLDQGPDTYSFGYDVEEPESRNVQFRRERRLPNGTVTGSYGLVEPDGNIKVVHYTADHLGYRVKIENSQRPNENYPPQPVVKAWDRPGPYWHSLWDPLYQPRDQPSPTLQHALDSLPSLGSPVHEQRTPPALQGDNSLRDSAPDQSQSYPSFLTAPDYDSTTS